MAASEARNKVLAKLNAIADVEIDDKGKFKYILIRIKDSNDDSVSKCIVRGYRRADYHADILEEVQPRIEALGLVAVCLGGGRIDHQPGSNSIMVYGYSMGFGRADHQETVRILQANYPSYNISWSNDGY
ncbi:14 kDa phosphohistidine phosphatase [Exaiptasia diaphana]|uniref:14 kDa phosphohistidine phosphatase n=1 Tax=Exaiptasia diaphana TaxID=2652724 RepID=A0A913Y1F5_EXADI|nr:14 kDa phosphohistidine phosphatase [Exaiptasia diaphana]KXJ23584.1 14 kDa phosphohistidine phosphatase [Exaiptasia diaphana]